MKKPDEVAYSKMKGFQPNYPSMKNFDKSKKAKSRQSSRRSRPFTSTTKPSVNATNTQSHARLSKNNSTAF